MLTLRLLKVATPFCGVAVSVPPRPVPPPRVSVTGLVAVVTVFPLISSTTTVTAGVMVDPAEAFEGCCENASCVGVEVPPPPPAVVMVKLLLVAEVRPALVADRVKVPALPTLRLAKVATPFCGVAVNVPAKPVPPPSASVTGLVAVVTVLPLLSCSTTVTAGVIVAPVDALEGCCEKANLVAGAGGGVPPPAALIVKPVLVAGVRPGVV